MAFNMAPEEGLEPSTPRLTAACSTIELLWNPIRKGANDTNRTALRQFIFLSNQVLKDNFARQFHYLLETMSRLMRLSYLEYRTHSQSLSENGARLCRRPAAARRNKSRAFESRNPLRLVEDDTAALRNFQTGSQERSSKCRND